MSQRLIAACIAVPAIIGLLIFAGLARLPYATYQPGGTLDVLGSDGNEAEIIQVDGAEVFRDDGQLRMTTVRVSPAAVPGEKPGINLIRLLSTWFDGDNAVYPYEAVHGEDETPESNRQEGALQMSTSQDYAVEVALREMDIDVPQVLKVAALGEGKPAEKVLQVGDILRTINGEPIKDDRDLVATIQATPEGDSVEIGIERAGTEMTVTVTPELDEGVQRIGITPGVDYDFPFDVKINISDQIGGPSAGLIFSLAVYDTLTEGSLTGGHEVAGTGEIYPDGTVGPIGGIQQKIAGARDDGAELFLVPIDNCADALTADNGDMRLMMAQTMHDVRVALEAYAADEDAELPSCEDADEILAAAS